MPYYFEYEILISLPDMGAMFCTSYPEFPDAGICGFAIDGFFTNFNSLDTPPINFRLDSTAIGSGANTGLIQFSNSMDWVSGGTYVGTQPIVNTPYGIDYDVAIISRGLIQYLQIVMRVTIPKWPITRLDKITPTYFTLLWLAKNVGYWAMQSYVPEITISGGNAPVIASAPFNGLWQIEGGGNFLSYQSNWNLTDLGVPSINQSNQQFLYRIPLNCADYCVKFNQRKKKAIK